MPSRRRIAVAAVLLIACAGPPAKAAAATPPPTAKTRSAWHTDMAKLRTPAKGCFKAAFPKIAWTKVTCVAPPQQPYGPSAGHRPFTVGNGNDISAAVTGTMTAAEGSFDSVSGVTSESGPVGGTGSAADSYSLQLNTSFFTTPLCAASPNPNCKGWEQFIYSSNNQRIFIQYWLIQYNTTCPAGWNTAAFSGSTYCWRNGAGAATVARQPITNLQNLKLAASANTSGNDTVKMFVGSSSATASNAGNMLSLGNAWNGAEFIIVGDCCNAQASFNSGSTITVRTTVHNGTTNAPTCVFSGFTGETNNLDLVGTAAVGTGPSPAVVSTQSNAPGGSMASCQAAAGVGDTHLSTFKGLLYDFQAQGDFVLADTGPDFQVQARQVSGAPTWPNASVNQAVGTRMGKTTVSVCLPDQLVVNGERTTVSPGSPLILPDGVDVSRTGNAYLVRGPNGERMRAQVNSGYIDVGVGLARSPSTVRGLLANANNDVNQVATSPGAVLKWPLTFSTLYGRYGDSWRVKGASAIQCGQRVKPTDPKKPFFAKDLNPEVAKRARAICVKAGVKKGPLLDACTLDVAVIGRNEAAKVFVDAPQPAAVGTITGGGGGGGVLGIRWWLILLILLVLILIVWLIMRKKP
jgi:hypothetical protein